LAVGPEDIFGISRESRPPEWSYAAAEQWTDVGRDEAGEVECVLQSHVLRHLADVIAIVERGNILGVKIQHGLDVVDHGGLGCRFDRFRVDESEIAFSGFIVSGSQTARVLQFVKASLDVIAKSVDVIIDRSRVLRVQRGGMTATPPSCSTTSRM
jgi:hypothetical protein